ncbi:MAG: hypothetical protein K2M15_07725 [Oscillospiraceae bacterium]|nr:hypothetical protein [Oscillospiraceae bacterium]
MVDILIAPFLFHCVFPGEIVKRPSFQIREPFIPIRLEKGKFNPRYCDRMEEWCNRTCRELAAQENFKEKAADRPALGVYDRYYRRYAARKKVRQIKEDEFKKWQYEAMRLRDDCEAGKLTVDEYKRWMEDYFPNRKKKNAEK